MRSYIFRFTGLAVAGLLFTALPAAAQQSTTRGWMLGLHGSGASLSIEGQDRQDAGGGGFVVGYGLNRRFTLLLQVDGAEFDDASTGDIEGKWTMGHVELGARFHFANSLSRWVPYLQAGLGFRATSVEDPIVNGSSEEEVEFSGAAFTFGGGVGFYLAESWSLDLGLLVSGGEFSTLRVNNVSVSGLDFDATSTRLNLGVRWWP
jgi:opacity protein-like surface antigen